MKAITKDSLKEALTLYKNGGLCGPGMINCAKCPWSDMCKNGGYVHLVPAELQQLLKTELDKFDIEDIVEELL